MKKQPFSVALSWTLLVLLSTSVGINALQARRIRKFIEPSSGAVSRVGQPAIPITGADVNGRPRTFTFDAKMPSVIYFFSKQCKWCEQNWANVRALAASSRGRFRFVAVAEDSDLAAFVKDRRLEFDVIGGITQAARKAFGFGPTPHTMVVSSQGQITNEWTGAFNGRRQRLIESFFDISLPGLDTPIGTR